jgi:uncharacterized protein YkwD
MEVNGQPVPATYSQASGRLEFRPMAPLPPGEVEVTASLVVNRTAKFVKKWEAIVREDAVPDYLAPDAQSNEALLAVNELRLATGLPVVKLDECLGHVAEMHSRYLSENRRIGHTQFPSEPGFFGASLKERLNRFGWNEPATEAVTDDFGSPTLSVNAAFDAPYHRLPFLAPGPVEFGVGVEGKALTLLFGHSSENRTVLSPAPQQSNVPNLWHNTENPNPVRFFNQAGTFLGYPVVISQAGSTSAIKVLDFEVRGPNGVLDCHLVDGTVDPQLRGAAFLIPARPLQRRTTYQVRARWTSASHGEQMQDWSFSTR